MEQREKQTVSHVLVQYIIIAITRSFLQQLSITLCMSETKIRLYKICSIVVVPKNQQTCI